MSGESRRNSVFVLTGSQQFRVSQASGLRSNLHFYRDSAGNEVNLVCCFADHHVGIETKAGVTVGSRFFDGLRRLSAALLEPHSPITLVHGGDQNFTRESVTVTNPRGFGSRLLAGEFAVDRIWMVEAAGAEPAAEYDSHGVSSGFMRVVTFL